MMRFVDLFAGIGGIRLGFEQTMQELGIPCHCVLSSEIDKFAQETYALNFGETPQGDIYGIQQFPEFDFLLAGFPCQPFSYAGKQQGFGDTRGTLFFEIERILREHRPKGFLLENVRGLTTHDKGRTFKTILQHLEALGYGVEYLLLNGSSFGIPQNRVRVYIVGIYQDTPRLAIQSDLGAADSHKFKDKLTQSSLFETSYPLRVVRDILEPSPASKYDCSVDFTQRLLRMVDGKAENLHGIRMIDHRNGNSIHSWELGIKGECTEDEIAFMNALIANRRKKHFGAEQDGKKLTLEQIKTFFNPPDLDNIMRGLLNKGYLKDHGGKFNPVAGNMSFEVFKFLDPDSISITLVSSDAHKLGVVHNGHIRRITPRECARLQGFPDSFLLHPQDTNAYRQFGNSVSVPVIKAVLLDLFRGNSQVLLPISTKTSLSQAA
ncbi:MAG TPA: DNA cytosine methyltransferase [Candidatus Thiothrix moscowensis]|uniref:DNA cytosine methyltransferase n=1 Tax=unclassified Thiothrix TaxID=2636184 RepID=UPI0025ECD7AF|nr:MULTISPECIES: DNA cytosine methyltransferase [unclassified Thiothrix]HRJ54091.1 DNA cytosine methyltransferase [Candidatus Thiothrix moscowensis]HRJ94237.1 DNA cytosine methyltransferase [Candidatus Thiothrix moscowensis]